MTHALLITFLTVGAALLLFASILAAIGVNVYRKNKRGLWSKIGGVGLLLTSVVLAAHGIWIAWMMVMAVAA